MTRTRATATGFVAVLLWALLALFTVGSEPAPPLLLNALWTIIFFGFRNPLLAFIEIIILLAAVAATTVKFYPISRTAAYLLAPYILWTAFAAALNLAIVMAN